MAIPTVNVAVLHENVPLVPVTNTFDSVVDEFDIVPETVTGIPAYKDTLVVEHEKLPVAPVIPVTVRDTPSDPVNDAEFDVIMLGLPVTLEPVKAIPTLNVPVILPVGVNTLPTLSPVPLEIIPVADAVVLFARVPETTTGCPTANPLVKDVQLNCPLLPVIVAVVKVEAFAFDT
jgi:hypothetical protein